MAEDRWTITVCPSCGEYRPFSAIDAVHGAQAVCSCTEVLGGGFMVGGTPLVAVEVKPVDPAWRGEGYNPLPGEPDEPF